DTRFPNDIYAIIKLLLERNANLDFMCEYLASGPANEFVDQCGHGTKQVRCSLREFVLSSDYKITAVKDLIRTLANQE
ncbi:MAG TPA: hypothetical protein VJJ83_05290, partial [Candidatus Babeliales bacterium]|nr:hypothetical protein [Candidatus Babeliales bacterium]